MEARYCHSTIKLSFIEEEEDITVWEKCSIDELHVFEGIVNHIFSKSLAIKIGKEKSNEMAKQN